MNKSTSEQYLSILNIINNFLDKELNGLAINGLVNKIKEGTTDPYNILSKYCSCLVSSGNISTITIKQRVITIKNFFEYCNIDINPRKFKLKVKLPKNIKKDKEALTKEDVVDILNNCFDIRLKTYVMLLAATGMRAVEALNICIKDIDYESKSATIYVRGENTKTRNDRSI